MKNNPRIHRILVLFLLTLFLFLTAAPSMLAAPSRWISRVDTTEKIIALTIDDGSDGSNYAKILQVLDKHNVKATFFLTGSGAQNHPQRIRETVAKGHELGNHSFNHPDFTKISVTEMKSQLTRTESAVKNISGRTTKPYFRAPYGATNPTVLNTVGNTGYTHTFHWSIDTLDWTGNSANTIYSRVMNNLHPGAIILMHTGGGAKNIVSAMDRFIPAAKSKGYRFVTISQLMGKKASLPVTGGSNYIVKRGDTLYSIARKYNTTVAKIAASNKISNVNLIGVGQVLKIPGTTVTPAPKPAPVTRTYTVRKGDTLYSIARRYNTTVAKIATANKISNVNLIRVGQVLRIP